jgi:hypothetical protein
VAQQKSDSAKERIVAALEQELGPTAREKVEAILTLERQDPLPALFRLAKSQKTDSLISSVAAELRREYRLAHAKTDEERARILSEGMSLYSFKSVSPPRLREPTLAEVALSSSTDGSFADAASQYKAANERQQGLYLAASGTLMQLNAIVAGILGVLLASTERGLLKSAVAIALVLHVISAFLLCWAARPVGGRDDFGSRNTAMAVVDSYKRTDDTFRNYRRGWRITLLALVASSSAAGLFVLHTFGVSVVDFK